RRRTREISNPRSSRFLPRHPATEGETCERHAEKRERCRLGHRGRAEAQVIDVRHGGVGSAGNEGQRRDQAYTAQRKRERRLPIRGWRARCLANDEAAAV